MKLTTKLIAIVLLVFSILTLLLGCGKTTVEILSEQACTSGTSLPMVHSYEVHEGYFSVTESTKLANDSSFSNYEDIFSDFANNLVAYGVIDNVLHEEENGDIVLLTDASLAPQAYRIEITTSGAMISAADADGAFYGMRTLLKLLISTDNQVNCGIIVDEPDSQVRAMHLAMANKLYSKDFVISLLYELAWNNMNELQLHFGEIYGLRFALDDMEVTFEDENGEEHTVDASICLTEPYFTESDMIEIIELAKSLHINIVPALDTPGHMAQLITPMIEANQIPSDYAITIRYDSLLDENGEPLSYDGLNLNNRGAVNYALGVFEKYIEFFSHAGVEAFHFGGDEYLTFQVDDTVSEETFYSYMNEVATCITSYGLEPRAWDDGVSQTLTNKNVVVTNWYGKYADKTEFKQINCNFYRLYYSMGESFRTKDDEKSVFELWVPSLFAGDTAPEGAYVHGAMYCIWGAPGDEQEVAAKMRPRLKAMAMKCWNSASATECTDKTGFIPRTFTLTMGWDSYQKVLERLDLAIRGFGKDGVPCYE